MRDFETWLQPQAVTLHGCWGNRGGLEAPRSFTYKRRHDLLAKETAMLEDTRAQRVARILASPDDVFCCVKAYMRDKWLQQAPVLALPASRGSRVPGRYPITAEAVRLTAPRAAQLESIAVVLERPQYGMMAAAAAAALRELANLVQPLVPPPGWLAENLPHFPLVVDSINAYFGHLPDISWHMRAKYHRI